MFKPEIKIGQIIDNSKLTSEFGCAPQGGMRRSKNTNTLVLISNHLASKDKIYDDKKIDGIYHYTGMGQVGDQSIYFSQNKTLLESKKNNVGLHLFEVFKPRQYTYMGCVELHGEPYAEEQIDAKGRPRKVWMFPLKLLEESNPATYLDIETILKLNKEQEEAVTKLSYDELKSRAVYYGKEASSRKVFSQTYIRNPYVAELTKRRSNGSCELCNSEAPFRDSLGRPYLESHHIVWLSNNGPDTIQNTAALCPNCHKKMHIVNDKNDKELLTRLRSVE